MTTYAIPTDALARAIVCASTDPHRPHIAGVHVFTRNGGVYVEATDGHVALRALVATADAGGALDVTIPTEDVKAALKLAGKRAEHVDVTAGTIGSVAFIPVDREFPNISFVLPKSTDGTPAVFSPDVWARAHRAATGGAKGVAGVAGVRMNGQAPAVFICDAPWPALVVAMPLRDNSAFEACAAPVDIALYA